MAGIGYGRGLCAFHCCFAIYDLKSFTDYHRIVFQVPIRIPTLTIVFWTHFYDMAAKAVPLEVCTEYTSRMILIHHRFTDSCNGHICLSISKHMLINLPIWTYLSFTKYGIMGCVIYQANVCPYMSSRTFRAISNTGFLSLFKTFCENNLKEKM